MSTLFLSDKKHASAVAGFPPEKHAFSGYEIEVVDVRGEVIEGRGVAIYRCLGFGPGGAPFWADIASTYGGGLHTARVIGSNLQGNLEELAAACDAAIDQEWKEN